jgi:hypothetical protein
MSEETPVETVETPAEATQPELTTAFVVAIDEENRVYLERNPEVIKLSVKREASLIEVRRYISEILMDLQAQAAGEYTVTALIAAQNSQTPSTEDN